MSDSRWYFTEEQLANSPSRKCGINAELELSYRQRAANLIQEMGQRLQVSQLCINTAIVYMHRFYAFHSFTMFHRNSIAAASFFLAAKVEEQPRKLEHVIKILNICLEKNDMSRDLFAEQAQELVLNENILLQTLGFDVAIDHPHTHVVKACQLFNIVTVSRELRQTCYFMASNSLHLTTMCLKYRPTVVAAFCIYIACKWSRWEIPDSSEGKAWYSYVDETVTLDTLKRLTEEYLQILERSPSKFKSKMKAITSNGQAALMKKSFQVNQSPSITDGPSTSHHKNSQHHDKHHHHHHHKNASMSSSNNNSGAANSGMNINANGNSRSSTSSSQSSANKAQMHQMPNSSSSSSSQYKQVPSSQINSSTSIPQPLPPTASSNHNLHRQRPPSSSSSQPQPYVNSSSSSNQPKPPLMDERSHGSSFYNSSSSSSSNQRMSDHSKHRSMSSSNSAPPIPPPQQNPPLPPSQQQQTPYMKLNSMNDQKQHNNSKQAPPYPGQNMEMHQKQSMKQSSADYHNRNNAMNPQLNQQIPNNPQKKPTWPQQQSSSSMSQQQQQLQASSHNQDKQQYPHLQKNLQQIPNSANILDQSASNMLNTSSSKSSGYNEMSSKQQQQLNSSQNDFWFNDNKHNEMSNKSTTPPRGQSLFSPSPEHDTNEKAKYMMMTGSLKNSPKEEKKSTPTKRDKSIHGNQSGSNKQQQLNPPLPTTTNHMDSKKFSKIDNLNASIPQLSTDQMMMDAQMLKKRSYSSIKDSVDTSHNREKIRKVDQIKMEPNIPSSLPVTPSQSLSSKIQPQSMSQPSSIYGGSMLDMPLPIPTKQPLETNPDVVKSLLAECFSTNNKYDLYDSPLDVINPELPDELFATTPTSVSSKSSSSHLQQNMSMKINQPQSTQLLPQQQQTTTSMNMTKHDSTDDLLDIKEEKMDSSAGESSRKDKKKSKKKKEKHKHKKKHKSSDREDRDDNKSDSSSLKIIFSKEGKTSTDTKSSPESFPGGLKIKIPINKDAGKIDVNQSQSHPQPAPIKLKISKEKFGSFTNLNNNNNSNSNNNNNNNSSSSSSSSHHHHKSKKDKDKDKDKDKEKDREKSKSKSSKHHNSSDHKDSSSY